MAVGWNGGKQSKSIVKSLVPEVDHSIVVLILDFPYKSISSFFLSFLILGLKRSTSTPYFAAIITLVIVIKKRRKKENLWGLKASWVAVCYLILFWFILFLPHFCLSGLTPCIWRLLRNYMKEDSKRLETKISFIFFLYFWVQQPFSGWENSSWIQMKWLNLLVKFLGIYMRKFGILRLYTT